MDTLDPSSTTFCGVAPLFRGVRTSSAAYVAAQAASATTITIATANLTPPLNLMSPRLAFVDCRTPH